MELFEHTIFQLHEKLKKREISSLDVTESLLKRIDQLDGVLNTYINITPEAARKQAREVDKRIEKGEISLLTGIPIAVKDNISIINTPTTCGSNILKNFISPYDAIVIERLRKEGVVFLGKTNMDEFAMGSSTENSFIGPTRNPWNKDYISGGSSGGSAAAVITRLCIAALGSDTGGSIRQPASHCGVVGLKPTYGRVSRFGLVAFASSLDQIGPITKDVRDCAILLQAICGFDKKDSTSVNKSVPDYTANLNKEIKGLKIGIPKEYFIEGTDKEVVETVNRAIASLASLGAEIIDISLPYTEYAVATYYIIAPSEASSNLARYDGVRYGFRFKDTDDLESMYRMTRAKAFGPEVIRRIMLGTYTLSKGYYDAFFKKASQVRTLIINDFVEAFKKCQILITPVAPTPAFKIGEKIDDPLTMYLSDIFTLSPNLAGIPCISIPYGMSSNGLPIGVQILGKYFDESTLIQTAYMLEKTSDISHYRLPF
jgi:aspartyl-tRNA(Asn)/glutamyl-tRNA(Gln) amidotransferase subunit A